MTLDLEFTAKIIWVLFIVGWGVIRYKPNIKSRRVAKSVVSRIFKERFSMIISSFGLGYIPAVWIFTDYLDSFDYSQNIALMVIGALLLVVSLRLFRLTHKALGKMWSHSLDLREGHQLHGATKVSVVVRGDVRNEVGRLTRAHEAVADPEVRHCSIVGVIVQASRRPRADRTA